MIDYRVGDTRALCAALGDGSVDLIATSPPFLALRSYLPADHPLKHAEIGSEPDPATFLDTLLGLTAEWGRVLSPFGSIAIELGDTYAGSGGAGGDYNAGGMRDGQNGFSGSARQPGKNGRHSMTPGASGGHHLGGNGWPRPKSLALIPQLYACSLAYGRNILTGQPSPAGQWLVRNVIVWHRPNPAPGALGDKFRPSTSYIVVATRNPKRWFDLSAVRGDAVAPRLVRVGAASASRGISGGDSGPPDKARLSANPAGAPPLDAWFDHDDHDTWTITTQPSRLSHYAMWPAKLAERLILSMCPAEVCRTCGEPRRRIEGYALDSYRGSLRSQTARAVVLADEGGLTDEHIAAIRSVGISGDGKARLVNSGHGKNRSSVQALYDEAKAVLKGYVREFCTTSGATPTTTWTDCGHDNYRAGVVLDPFAGTGTTLCVADLHGRDAIGFDIDPRNAELMEPRIAEVRRALFGTQPEIPGQLDMFGDDDNDQHPATGVEAA